jgi:hypothetical protein
LLFNKINSRNRKINILFTSFYLFILATVAILKTNIKTITMNRAFHLFYFQISKKMEKHSADLMRYALAIVYSWFGTLKLVGISPAGEVVEQTVFRFKPEIFIPALGLVEVLIGIGFIFKKLIPVTIIITHGSHLLSAFYIANNLF